MRHKKNKGLALTSTILLYLYQRHSDRLIDIKCNPLYNTKISNQKQKKEYQNLAEYYLKIFIQNKCYIPSSSSPTLPTVFFEAQDYLNLAFFKNYHLRDLWAYHNTFRIIAKLIWLLRDILDNFFKKATFHTYLIT